MRFASTILLLVLTGSASVVFGRAELRWSAPVWEDVTPATADVSLALRTGEQHVLSFSGSVVRATHEVTGREFTFAPLPFAVQANGWVCRGTDGSILLASGRADADGRREVCRGWLVSAGTFGWPDLAVIALYFVGMLALGGFFMRRNKGADDYFRGGGHLPWWAVSLSIYATMFSSITFLSIPAWSFLTDCRYAVLAVGTLVLAPVVVRFYLPYFRRLNLTSAYEFLEVRYNLACRLFASAVFILFMVARTAIVTYLPAVALAAVTGIDVNVAILAVTAVTIVYCTIGGIEAVIWGDFLQSLILFVGTAVIFIVLVHGSEGGLGGCLRDGWSAGKFRFLDLSLDWSQPVFWVVLVGGMVSNLSSYTSDQSVVQRYMTTKDEASAGKSILLNGVLSFINCLTFFVIGVALWTFFRAHPECLDVTMPKNDSVMPLFIADNLPTGVRGLIFGAVAAATMSTLSSNLNSAATAVATDFYGRLFRSATDRDRLLCGKVATAVTGILGGGFALALANMEIKSIYDAFQLFIGTLTAGLSCLFFMGVFVRRVGGGAALAGLLANYAVCAALRFLPWGGKPHILIYGACGMATCLAVSLAVSLFKPNKGKVK